MSRILLGVSGGIAAYKALELVRLATGAGHAVRVVQTPTSRRFVGTASFAALSGAPVLVSEFQRDPARGAFPDQRPPDHDPISHLELVANADLFLIAPASANTIAKLAAGLADNLLGSCALAAGCPLLIAPAMNSRMYEHPATERICRRCARGAYGCSSPPAAGWPPPASTASGGWPSPPACWRPARPSCAASRLPTERPSAQRARRTAPPAADRSPARGCSSPPGAPARRSTACASSATAPPGGWAWRSPRRPGAGGPRWCCCAPTWRWRSPPGSGAWTSSAPQQLREACEREFPACDVLLMAAAVADFAPVHASEGKIKKGGRETLSLELAPTADILSELAGRRRDGQTLVGFAAEHGPDGVAGAQAKLASKQLDALVVNDISRADIGFDSADNEVTILTAAEGGSIERLAGRRGRPRRRSPSRSSTPSSGSGAGDKGSSGLTGRGLRFDDGQRV